MKKITLTLSDNNYTVQAKTDIDLDSHQDNTLKKLVDKIESGLYSESAAYLSIEGLTKKPVILTITECADELA